MCHPESVLAWKLQARSTVMHDRTEGAKTTIDKTDFTVGASSDSTFLKDERCNEASTKVIP